MERKYSEKEQGQVFARAIALQREAGHALTLSQMEATALEAGIDPQFLHAAVEELAGGVAPVRANMLPRWQGAALSVAAMAQIYTVSGQVLASQRDVYFSIAFAAVVGAIFAGRRLVKSLGIYLAVAVVTAGLTAAFLIIGAGSEHLETALPQAVALLVVQCLLFTIGHWAASVFLKREQSAPVGLRDRLAFANASSTEETIAGSAVGVDQRLG